MNITDKRLVEISQLFTRRHPIENGGVAEVTPKEVVNMATELLQWRLIHSDRRDEE